jgi:hypothetical protein
MTHESCVEFRGATLRFPASCQEISSGDFPTGKAELLFKEQNMTPHADPTSSIIGIIHPEISTVAFDFVMYSNGSGFLNNYVLRASGQFVSEDPFLGQPRENLFTLKGEPFLRCTSKEKR